MKLSSPFEGSTIVLTQSPHGAYQNGQAIDCVPLYGYRVKAPCDMEIYYRKNDLGFQSYSYARDENWRIVFVHCIIEKGGKVKRGEDIGYLHNGGAVHLHYAIEVNGVWENPLNYTDRSVKLTLSGDFKSDKWRHWSTYPDKQLRPFNSADKNMIITKENLEKMKRLVNKYNTSVFKKLKTPTELTAWWIKNGIYETLAYIEKLIAQSNKRADQIRTLKAEKTLLQNEIKELEKSGAELEVANTNLVRQNEQLTGENGELKIANENLEVYNLELRNENTDITAKLETQTTLTRAWETKYKRCAEGQEGIVIDIEASLRKFVEWLKKILQTRK